MREELLLTYLAIFLQLYKKTSHICGVRSAQFKQKQRKVKMGEINCKWLRMSNIS